MYAPVIWPVTAGEMLGKDVKACLKQESILYMEKPASAR